MVENRRPLLINLAWSEMVPDAMLARALSYAYTYNEELRPLVDETFSSGLTIRWGNNEKYGGHYDPRFHRIIVSSDLELCTAGYAALLAHEIYHATRRGKGDVIREEIIAGEWEAATWLALPEFTKRDGYREQFSEMVRRWKAGTIHEFVMANY